MRLLPSLFNMVSASEIVSEEPVISGFGDAVKRFEN